MIKAHEGITLDSAVDTDGDARPAKTQRLSDLLIFTRAAKAACPIQHPNCLKSFALICVHSRTNTLCRITGATG
jgi:hypothetical protein